MLKDSEFQTSLTDSFISIVGIRKSKLTLLAIAKLKEDSKDYLARFLRVKPNEFTKILAHLEKCQQIGSPGVQRILKLVSDFENSEICILYEPGYMLLERIDACKKLSPRKLDIFLHDIHAGLLAQKAALNTENNFLDEWNIFQSHGGFCVGASLPSPASEILLPLTKTFDKYDCVEYQSLDTICFAHEMTVKNHNLDVFCFGIMALRAIGINESFEQISLSAEKSLAELLEDNTQFEKFVEAVVQESQKSYPSKQINVIAQMLKFDEKRTINDVLDGLEDSPNTNLDSTLILANFHNFTNGEIIRDESQIAGHHGKFFNKRMSSVQIKFLALRHCL